jgi:dipeptidyl aminopeptidase/acylaminoacyl peptidase
MTRRRTLAFVLVAVVLLPAAPFRAAGTDQRPIELADIMAWRFITASALSADGVWFGYQIGPTEGDSDVVFRQTQAETEFKFPVGEVPGRGTAPVFSHDVKFAAFTAYPTRAEAAQLRRQRRPLQNRTAIVNLETRAKVEVPNVRRFAVAPGRGWIAMHKYAPESAGSAAPAAAGRAPAGSSGAASDLVLRELATGQQIVIGNVADFGFDKKGRHLAWIVDTQDRTGNGLQIRDMETGVIRSLESDDRAVYSRMSWSEDGDGLALVKGLPDRTPGDIRYFVVGIMDVGSGAPQKTVFNPATAPGFPAGMIVSPNRSPVWSDDRAALLFGIQVPRKGPAPAAAVQTRDRTGGTDPRAASAAASADDIPPDERVDLVVWHWQDKRLQSQQQVQETQDRNFSYLSAYRPAEKKFIRLADEQLPEVAPAPGGKFAIGRDDDPYELMGNLDGRRFQDVYVVDMVTGRRTLAIKKSRWTYGPSPTGTHFLYFDDGHYYTYDMAAERATNITKGLPTSFVDVEDDHTVTKPPTLSFGWSTDGRFVLLSDDWDIWQVPVAGGPATNLTLTGKKEQIRFRRPVIFDPDQRGFDLSKPLYVELYGEWTKKGGIGVIEPGARGVKRLAWDDASFAVPGITKARAADVYVYTRQTYKDPPDYHAAGPSLAGAKRITNLAAGTERFRWSSGATLVDYVSAKGDKLQGALFLPAGYEKGKTYPMVVNIYEKLSANLHSYARLTQPNPTNLNKTLYTSQGYAVFLPDITYKLNDPGLSAVWCVVPAVKAAIATGIVDPKRIGLMGHSWGGYQTAFLITQTDLFAAAVASAPLTDFISMYSLIYKATGGANSTIAETTQGRMTGGPWDNVEAYVRNSPVLFAKNVKTPLVILHNDRDGAVDFTQGVELFNALRRLQKPVVMLEYPGETHGLARRPNGKDFMLRVQEFFDHFLQGKPMPGWFKNGVPRLEMEEHLKSRRVPTADR